MKSSKAAQFTLRQNRIASLSKAIGHPARVAILEFLIKNNTCICGDIVDELPLSQSTVSQHLKELKNAGLIKGTIQGPRVCYCIDDEVWSELREKFGALFDSYTGSSSHCC